MMRTKNIFMAGCYLPPRRGASADPESANAEFEIEQRAVEIVNAVARRDLVLGFVAGVNAPNQNRYNRGVSARDHRLKTALVLSGGGARGAYEVGVLRYLREELPLRLGHMPRLDILCGTSVGAINAAYLAATADDPAGQARRLGHHWCSLTLENVLHLTMSDLFHAARLILGGPPPPPRAGELGLGGLLNTAGLQRFVLRHVPWKGISANVAAGHVEALSVSATHVASGNTVVFVERKGGELPPWSRDPFVRARAAHIGPLHVLASAAIPVLFSAVPLDGHFHCDGGLRQNTPLSPALRLGADRVLVISLRHLPTPSEEEAVAAARERDYPNPWFLFGKALNALLLDHTDYDLDRLHRMNAIVDGGIRAFGDRFLDELNRVLLPLRGQGVRLIRSLRIRPSRDIGTLAAAHARSPRLSGTPGLTGRALRYLAGEGREADLFSYLLFDGRYAADLIELGHADARAREAELVEFFQDRPALEAAS
jgi:NTE family protein